MVRTLKKQVAISEEVYNRLRVRGKYGDTLSGVIQELLDLADKYDLKPQPITKPPEPIKTTEQNMEEIKNGSS